jgi:hypothetical protein
MQVSAYFDVSTQYVKLYMNFKNHCDQQSSTRKGIPRDSLCVVLRVLYAQQADKMTC